MIEQLIFHYNSFLDEAKLYVSIIFQGVQRNLQLAGFSGSGLFWVCLLLCWYLLVWELLLNTKVRIYTIWNKYIFYFETHILRKLLLYILCIHYG